MTDRELLELAALAAGIHNDGEGPRVDDEQGFFLREWNPLTDDGDALRLAVKLVLLVEVQPSGTTATSLRGPIIGEANGSDPYAATRRAIVRAAAEVGKSMSGQSNHPAKVA